MSRMGMITIRYGQFVGSAALLDADPLPNGPCNAADPLPNGPSLDADPLPNGPSMMADPLPN